MSQPMSGGTTQKEVFVDVSWRVPKLWADCWSWCCIVCSVGVFMMGVIHWDDGRCLQKGYRRTAMWGFLPVVRGCGDASQKYRWDFYVSSTQTSEERREWVSCPADTGRNGENEILTLNQSEHSWRTVTLRNPHLITESGGRRSCC